MMKKIGNSCWYSANIYGRHCTVQIFSGVKSSLIAWSKYAKTVQIFAGGKFLKQIRKKLCKYLRVEQHLASMQKTCKSQLCLRNIQMHHHIQMLSYKEMNNEKKRKSWKKRISFADKFFSYITVDISWTEERGRELVTALCTLKFLFEKHFRSVDKLFKVNSSFLFFCQLIAFRPTRPRIHAHTHSFVTKFGKFAIFILSVTWARDAWAHDIKKLIFIKLCNFSFSSRPQKEPMFKVLTF